MSVSNLQHEIALLEQQLETAQRELDTNQRQLSLLERDTKSSIKKKSWTHKRYVSVPWSLFTKNNDNNHM
jgi:predicted oxidoreductase